MTRTASVALSIATIGLVAAAATGVAQARVRSSELTQVAQFDRQATDVAVTEESRSFINFSHRTDDAPISVAKISKTD